MENRIWIEEQFLIVEDLFGKGDFAEGKTVLENILEAEPGYGRAHNHIGWLYYAKLDDYKKAQYHYELAMRFAADYPAAYMNYTYLLNFLNKHADLVAHVERALQVGGVSKAALYNELGKSYELNGQYPAASKAYMDALRFSLNKEESAGIQANLERVKTKTGLFGRKLFFF